MINNYKPRYYPRASYAGTRHSPRQGRNADTRLPRYCRVARSLKESQSEKTGEKMQREHNEKKDGLDA